MSDKNVKVLNFVQKRQDNIENKRRSFERLMFQHVLGVYSVVDTAGSITPIQLVDISREGCLIQIPGPSAGEGSVAGFKREHEVTLRMYFTDNSYIPVIARVKHVRGHHEDKDGRSYLRYGLEFDQSMSSFGALQSFIEFLYKFAELSVVDKGDRKIFFL